MEFSVGGPFGIMDVRVVPVCDIAPKSRCKGDKGEENASGRWHSVRIQ
jgi:hypothetical protein